MYPSLHALLSEWLEGIVYEDQCKRTIPFQQLEQDFQEGIQKKHTDSWPWRIMTDRNAIRDRKTVICYLLSVEKDGKDVHQVMTDLESRATEELQESKKKSGAKPTLFLLVLEYEYVRAESVSINIHSFESDVLGWKHTDQTKARASSKQNAKAMA